MKRWMSGLCLAIVMALAAAPAAAGKVSLRDKAGLETALAKRAPCCVVDGRSEANRKKDPLVGAALFREGMTLDPAGPVVVVADTDARALEIGRTLEKAAKAQPVLAVKGGIATWRTVELPDPASFMPQSFVIPSDTCQSGPALQSLPFDRP